jgi:hypothetical protein
MHAIAGVFTLTLTGSTTLAFTTNSSSTTYTDESGRNKTIILSGALSATTVTLSVPNIEKDYVIINNSGGTVTSFIRWSNNCKLLEQVLKTMLS